MLRVRILLEIGLRLKIEVIHLEDKLSVPSVANIVFLEGVLVALE